ncbi:hypothetical protein AGMMS50239_38790 [Bacteroidia bacterium]|nr:hypothetical protein AGMMS50239_38790 [Bacteroidia bacterium]
MDKLVSILTPCYNGEKYIWRLLDSILNQTYSRIEMIVMDDGSIDNSAAVIRSYIPRFEARDYSLTYVYQANSGQSVAVNNGLKFVKGDYLAYPDCDDFYATNDAIEQMIKALEGSDDSVVMVRCQAYLLDENTLKITGDYKSMCGKYNLFEDCLFGLHGYCYNPGIIIIISKLDELIPDREIYIEKHAGQNWQIQLPLLYKYKSLTIEKFLYNIVERSNSHSRGQYPVLTTINSYENTLLNTLDRIIGMSEQEREQYKKSVRYKYRKRRLLIFTYQRQWKNVGKTLVEGDVWSNFRLLFSTLFAAIRKMKIKILKR